MKNYLFVCNTPYHILVSIWIKYHYYKDCNADIIINNKLKGYNRIQQAIEREKVFSNVLILDDRHKKNKISKVNKIRKEYSFAKKVMSLNSYDAIFSANLDFFTQRLVDFGKRKCENLKFNYYEDGIASYGKRMESFYNMYCKACKGNINHNNIGVKYPIKNNMNAMYVFSPKLMEWTPKTEIIKIDSINKDDSEFKTIVNNVFGYESLEDSYEKKYIFFEESFYADTGYMEDVKLIEQIADVVGKDNLFIKIHPRNPENRFKKLGYHTNVNTIIPWEVLALNMNLDDKVLITIASASILASAYIFNVKAKSISVINCLNEYPDFLKKGLGNTVINAYTHFDNINLVNSIEEI